MGKQNVNKKFLELSKWPVKSQNFNPEKAKILWFSS